jgi:hypothetical protein
MSAIDSTEAPTLAAPLRPEGRPTLRQYLRVLRENALATYRPEDFGEDIMERRLLWRRTFIVNEPDAIRQCCWTMPETTASPRSAAACWSRRSAVVS